MRVLGVVVLVLALMSIVVNLVAGVRYNQQTRRLDEAIACQTSYNLAISESLARRGQSADQERDRTQERVQAEIQMWLTLLAITPKKPGEQTQQTRQQGIAALNTYLSRAQAYLRASRAAGAVRVDNPLPSTCGRPA
jgi:uncharacterized protein YmfQ (DUF2313 family)